MRSPLTLFPPAMPHKFKYIHRRFGNRPFSMLDIGAGNHSASRTRTWFPHCRYTGVDRDRTYQMTRPTSASWRHSMKST